jgi:hypothetical protein
MFPNLIRNPLGIAAIIASAAGGPYLLYETDAGRVARQTASGMVSTAPGGGSSLTFGPTGGEGYVGPSQLVGKNTADLWNYTTGVPSLEQLQTANPAQPLVGGPVRDLRDIIRFDVTPGWVAQNFGRVSTVLADVQLDGLRVPIVTGTTGSDMAGTITYYFDHQQQLRRINLQGLTGDPSGIANLMQQFYHLKPEASLGGHLYTTRWNNRITSLLHVAPAPIMYATAEHSRYTVFLELNQPSLPYGLSYEAAQILQTGHQTDRFQ